MKRFILFLSCILLPLMVNAQQQYDLDLDQVIELAQSDAPSVKLAETRRNNSYWIFQSYKADFRPQIDLVTTLPSLNRSIQPITLPDGAEQFVSRSLLTNEVELTLQQVIPLTGGTVFASTSLQQLNLLKTSTNDPSTSYLANPISIGFIQPLNGYNPYKWQKLVQPLRFERSQREYSEDMERVAYDAVSYYFNVLTAQLDVAAAERQKAVADTLLRIGEGRFSVGNIAETELLQLEVSSMNANASLAQAKLDQQTFIEELRNFLGIKEEVFFQFETPGDIPDVEIQPDQALALAKQNRSDILFFQENILLAEERVNQTKSETGLDAQLFGRIGLTQSANTLGGAYRNPLDQELVTLGLTVPLADWGKAKSRFEIARSNLELVKLTTEQDQISFEREVIIRAQQFDLVRENVFIAKTAWDSAQKRFELTRNRYVIGKVSVTELNLAIDDQERLRKNYILALRNFWTAYYELRLLTLYDFINDRPLIEN